MAIKLSLFRKSFERLSWLHLLVVVNLAVPSVLLFAFFCRVWQLCLEWELILNGLL